MAQTTSTTHRRFSRIGLRGALIFVGAIGLSVATIGLASDVASASYPTSGVTVYTGCLTVNGTGSGQINSVAANPTKPLKSCNSNEMIVHLSGGTITSIVAGTGLTGGGSDGQVTVSLAPGYSLPQSCSAGNIPGWTGSAWTCYKAGTGLTANTGSNEFDITTSYQLPQTCTDSQLPQWSSGSSSWSCVSDNDTTYTNGTGIDLSSGTFSLNSAYRLPQACSSGQFPASDGSNGWSCGTDVTYNGANFATSNQSCATGQVATGVDSNGNLTCSNPQPVTETESDTTSASCLLISPCVAGRTMNLTVSCPAGDVLTGGGASVFADNGGSPAGAVLTEDDQFGNGWAMNAVFIVTQFTGTFNAYIHAICAKS